MTLTTGVLAGVLATLLAGGLSWLVRVNLVPLVGGWIYRCPDIHGQWTTHDSVDAEPVGTAEIVQRGSRIQMTTTRTRTRSGRQVDRKFTYHGWFFSGQLTLLFEEKKIKGYITGAMVLRLSADSKRFVGKTTYLDQEANEVVSHDFFLVRDGIAPN